MKRCITESYLIDVGVYAFTTVCLIISFILLLQSFASAETWTAITSDNVVISVLDVKVERSELTQTETQYTLRHLYKRKAILEADLAEINSLIAQIEPIADEVELKVKEVVE